MLPRFLPGVAVGHHAESGETMKSFISGLRLAKVLSQAKAGDFLFIQFGHSPGLHGLRSCQARPARDVRPAGEPAAQQRHRHAATDGHRRR
jgi:lysophospholipase L1-like esterase